MNDIFSIIGSVASLGGIPLAIYLYFRSKEAGFDKARREIVKILSYQIGEGRTLTTFEIETVSSSKIREIKGNPNSIKIPEIIEDLVAETISSPLLERSKKEEILSNLKSIYDKTEVYNNIDKLIDEINSKDSEIDVIRETSKVIRTPKKDRSISSSVTQLSTIFGVIASLITIIVFIVPDSIDIVSKFLSATQANDTFVEILGGLIVGLLAGILSSLIKKFQEKRLENRSEKSI